MQVLDKVALYAAAKKALALDSGELESLLTEVRSGASPSVPPTVLVTRMREPDASVTVAYVDGSWMRVGYDSRYTRLAALLSDNPSLHWTDEVVEACLALRTQPPTPLPWGDDAPLKPDVPSELAHFPHVIVRNKRELGAEQFPHVVFRTTSGYLFLSYALEWQIYKGIESMLIDRSGVEWTNETLEILRKWEIIGE